MVSRVSLVQGEVVEYSIRRWWKDKVIGGRGVRAGKAVAVAEGRGVTVAGREVIAGCGSVGVLRMGGCEAEVHRVSKVTTRTTEHGRRVILMTLGLDAVLRRTASSSG
jgi:hypothetical protein